MSVVVVGVGSNLGSREASIRAARLLLDARDQIEIEQASPLYETEPLGPPQPYYLNAAFRLKTTLSPPELLQVLLRTEQRLGRDRHRTERWGARSLDLDLLWDARGPYESAGLHVPHKALEQRDFALTPLLHVAPELRERFGRSLERLGGALAEWDRASIAQDGTSGSLESDVEADSLVDACALSVMPPPVFGRPFSTRHVAIDPNPDAFASALRDLLQGGFAPRCVSVSHCSKTQWDVQFHGVNLGNSLQADVRLQTTSGARRLHRARMRVTIETP